MPKHEDVWWSWNFTPFVLHVSGSRSLLTQKPPSWSFEEVSKWERFCEGRMNRIYTGIYKPIAAYGCIMDLEGRQMSCESSESESKTWNPEQASGMNRVLIQGFKCISWFSWLSNTMKIQQLADICPVTEHRSDMIWYFHTAEQRWLRSNFF